jgi:APA family basic amino acid/polyamine antiporter
VDQAVPETKYDSGGGGGVITGVEKRPLSLFSATIIVIANMIGTGVFTTLGLQLAGLPSPFTVLLLWVLGGLGAFCGALCYGELGAMMPRSGGEYTYLSNIYHPAVGFLSGWVSIVAGFAAPIALAAIALGEYTGAVIPWMNKTVIAVSATVILATIHLVDVKTGCRLQNTVTALKVILIGSLIFFGLSVAAHQNISLLPTHQELGAVFSPVFITSLVYVFYAYSGWNAASYVAGEIAKPEKNLPLSLFLGTAVVTLCYLLLNFVFLYTVPVSELSGKIDVGYLSARAIFGSGGGTIMTLLICLALVSSLSSLIMVGPRVAQTMSEDLGIFSILAKKNSSGAPVYAIILQSAIALALTLTSTFDWVLTYVGFTLALFASLSVAGVFVLRLRNPRAKRPFHTWGYPVTPAIFLLLYGWMVCYLIIEKPWPSFFGLLTMAAGLLLYRLLAPSRALKPKLIVLE